MRTGASRTDLTVFMLVHRKKSCPMMSAGDECEWWFCGQKLGQPLCGMLISPDSLNVSGISSVSSMVQEMNSSNYMLECYSWI
jgi:hypothetical protein